MYAVKRKGKSGKLHYSTVHEVEFGKMRKEIDNDCDDPSPDRSSSVSTANG